MTRVLVVGGCVVLLLAGVAAAVAWRGRRFLPPPAVGDLEPLEVVRRFAWYAAIAVLGGTLAGVTVIGCGGRLAMRLLAVTSSEAAQGKITEADEVVGAVTVDGTIGFVLFNGIFGGIAAAAVYLVLRRMLPDGPLGGVLFGLGLLIVLGTTIDPLRKDNPDFELVGPGWLAVVVFTLLAVLFGLALAACVARLSAWLPLPAARWRVALHYVVPALLAVLAFVVMVPLVVACLLAVIVTRWRPIVAGVRSRRWVTAVRVVAVAGVALALPNALTSVVDIAG